MENGSTCIERDKSNLETTKSILKIAATEVAGFFVLYLVG